MTPQKYPEPVKPAATRLLLVAIRGGTDIVLARNRTRRLAELLGFDTQDQTRITTAVSEIVRNTYEYAAGGTLAFAVAGRPPAQLLEITVQDKGGGIANLAAVLEGSYRSPRGMGVGMLGARRLMDEFEVTSGRSGTTVRMTKALPRHAPPLTQPALRRVMDALAADGPADAVEEITRQNQQILLQLDALNERRSELERLNQELQDTNRGVVALYAELDDRADHLRRADELKSRFLSHMSHEFRTPLNSILALSRLLLARTDGPLGDEQEKQVLFIRKAAENLTELVDDLLDLAKVEAGKITISPQVFTAESLFGTLRGMLRPLLLGDNVALQFGDTAEIPPLETDEGKVSQILRNFISNALKFTERGEVQVSAAADPVADTVTFSVRDTGIGIAPEDIEVIFEEFGQVVHPLQSRVKGTGLGLPLARKLAELLGGRITVTSTPGRGSTFAVELPRRYHGAAGDAASQSPPDWTPDPARIPVLLVEDDEADAFAVERWLAGTPFQLLRARSINEAQQAFKSVTPAVILLDVVLLGDESWRLMLHLRQSTTYDDIPLVVLSSTGDDRKALHFGADEYLSKPVDGPSLIALLRRLTGSGDAADILVVDDEEVSRYLVRQLLPKSRFAVREANGTEAGLRQIGLARPALVLLDINMPGMDGYEFLARIDADPTLADLPTIVLTSAIIGPAERARLARASRIVSKSELGTIVLSDAIDEVLAAHATAAPGSRHPA